MIYVKNVRHEKNKYELSSEQIKVQDYKHNNDNHQPSTTACFRFLC